MTLQAPKVLLAELVERTSARGNKYLSGWLGKARIVGFWADGQDRDGSPTTVLRLFVQEAEQKPQERPAGQRHADPQGRAERAAQKAQRSHEDALANLNDPIPD
ncbi:MAG TPA: hypothetical protein VHL31_20635 [Geminicoccus sp.]|jgi:hypothetical protein|uniref:hypothetical protein n=1 Tax=Geminicoccus sp. TaxID=2024832 RepID=UPI002E30DC1A|nr:hypothetical protein [Geminicoccus sp.]HEX2528688.1 hypothetical protein [Geminicoccus sp.]